MEVINVSKNNYINNEGIDLSDIPEITDFSGLRRVPSNYAELMKNGYSVNINFQSMKDFNEYIVSDKASKMLKDEKLKSISLTLNKAAFDQDNQIDQFLQDISSGLSTLQPEFSQT